MSVNKLFCEPCLIKHYIILHISGRNNNYLQRLLNCAEHGSQSSSHHVKYTINTFPTFPRQTHIFLKGLLSFQLLLRKHPFNPHRMRFKIKNRYLRKNIRTKHRFNTSNRRPSSWRETLQPLCLRASEYK